MQGMESVIFRVVYDNSLILVVFISFVILSFNTKLTLTKMLSENVRLNMPHIYSLMISFICVMVAFSLFGLIESLVKQALYGGRDIIELSRITKALLTYFVKGTLEVLFVLTVYLIHVKTGVRLGLYAIAISLISSMFAFIHIIRPFDRLSYGLLNGLYGPICDILNLTGVFLMLVSAFSINHLKARFC